MKQLKERAAGEVPTTHNSRQVFYGQMIVIGLFAGVNVAPVLFELVPEGATAGFGLNAHMLTALANALLAPAACWAVGSLAVHHWTRNGTAAHGAKSRRAVILLALLVLFMALYAHIGMPFDQLFLTHTHGNGAVREFLLLLGGIESEYLSFAE